METPTTKVNIIQQAEIKLETKKDLLRLAYLTYLETIKTGGTIQQTKAIINFISSAVAYLPDGVYKDVEEPKYFEFVEEYFKNINIIVPQQKEAHTKKIEWLFERKCLVVMEKEYRTIHKLLEKHTNIFADKKIGLGTGKV